MFTLPLDILLVFTAVSPVIGWVAPKLYRARFAGAFAAIALAVTGIALYSLYLTVSSSGPMYLPSNSLIGAHLKVDMLSIFMTSIFLGLGLAATVYSIIYVEKNARTPIYYTLILTMISGMIGIVFSGDLFTLFVFWELMSISTYALVSFYRERWASIEASLKFLIMSAAGSATALFGISLLYGMTGTLSFEGLTAAFSNATPSSWLYIAALFIFVGFGVKAAVVPLHTWLPDAYSSAPAPITAMLSGIVIGPGIYVIARTFFSAFLSIQAEWLPIIAVLSFITMIIGNVTALLQTDLKRMLAYSSIAQVGYMLVGLAVGTQTGLTGTFLQFFNHALIKGVAFLCAGAIIFRLGARELHDMIGVGRKMPITAVVFSISLFALIGMPPFNGFISELTLFTSTFQVNLAWLGIALIVNSAISAAYYLRIVKTIMQIPVSEKMEKVKEVPLLMLIPLCVLAVSIIVFGIWPDPLVNFAKQAAKSLVLFGGLI
jgi:proton-translocating NADH-quinone oxidoreductase chain N